MFILSPLMIVVVNLVSISKSNAFMHNTLTFRFTESQGSKWKTPTGYHSTYRNDGETRPTGITGYINLINEDRSIQNCGDEQSLSNFLKYKMDRAGAVLLAEEWKAVTKSYCGRGDLVFRLPDGIDLVVEVKRIDPILVSGSSKTHRRNRNYHRHKVIEQAKRYGEIWCYKSTVETVAVATFTEEIGLKLIAIIVI